MRNLISSVSVGAVIASAALLGTTSQAATEPISPTEFQSTLSQLHESVEKEKEILKAVAGLEAERKPLDEDIEKFNASRCYYRSSQSECDWYFRQRDSLAKRKSDLLERYNVVYSNAMFAKSRVSVLKVKLRLVVVLQCPAAFSERARACAAMPGDEAAYACLKDLWENSRC